MKILLDSTCDLPDEYLKKYDIGLVPIYVNIDNKTYLDRYDLQPETFYKYLRDNRDNVPTTSGTSPKEFLDRIEKNIDDHSTILVSTVTAKLSTTFQSALIAKKRVKSDKVVLLDSMSGSGGLGLLGISASKLVDSGMPDDEVISKIIELRDNSIVAGYIDDLHHLRLSGRLTATKYWLAAFMRAKPLLQIKDGIVVPLGKGSGKEKAIKKLIKTFLKKIDKKKTYDLMITHSDDAVSAEYIASELEKKIPLGEKIVNYLTPALAVHFGLETIIVALVPVPF